MSQPIVVQGDLVQFLSPIGTAVLVPSPATVPIAITGWRPTIQSKPMCIVADALATRLLAVSYTTGAHISPGTGNLSVTGVNVDQSMPWLTINGQPVLLKGSQFNALFTTAVPATQPPPTSTPDPELLRDGFGTLAATQALVFVG